MSDQNFISQRSVSPSFDNCKRRVRVQLEVNTLIENGDYTPEVEDIVNIVTDVYMRSPKSCIRIGGQLLDVSTVVEMYKQLTGEHVQLVIEKFRSVTYEIKNTSMYLRTALYNSVMEYNSHYSNVFNSGGGTP